jgi:hypothetical protein
VQLLERKKHMYGQTITLLNLSEEIQEILQQQQIDLYQVIQEELPETQISVISDPLALHGEKSLTTAILASVPAIIYSIAPIVIRVLNQFKPDTTEIRTEETETHHADGSFTIHRISVSIQRQHNQQASLAPSPQQKSLPSAQNQGN